MSNTHTHTHTHKQTGSSWNFPPPPIPSCSSCLDALFQNQRPLILLLPVSRNISTSRSGSTKWQMKTVPITPLLVSETTLKIHPPQKPFRHYPDPENRWVLIITKVKWPIFPIHAAFFQKSNLKVGERGGAMWWA